LGHFLLAPILLVTNQQSAAVCRHRLVSLSEIARAHDEEKEMRTLLPAVWAGAPLLVSHPILLQALSGQIHGKVSAGAPANAQLVWVSALDLSGDA
jgi:hypothetical protein